MTIGLAIITKTATTELMAKLSAYADYFDQIYIQVNGGEDAIYNGVKYQGSSYKWNDNFADARNALHAEIKTDYWVWADTDDDLLGLENLQTVVDTMTLNNIEVMFAPYHYEIKDDQTVVLQWRERIIKTSVPGKWMGRIHETFVPDVPVRMDRTTLVQWKHDKTEADYKASKARNLKILEEEVAKPEPDPRDMHYLALAYLGEERWQDAIEAGKAYISVGGWDEELYRTWLLIATAELELEHPERALAACMGATRILPNYPDAYYYLQDVYYHMGDYLKSLEWWRVAIAKAPTQTNSPLDPTIAKYRAAFSAAMSYSMLGKVEEAYNLMKQVEKVAPNSREVKEWLPDIAFMYHEAIQIQHLEEFAEYYASNEGDLKLLYQSLPPAIQAYPQISMMLKKYETPTVWPSKSIVFFCGPGLETWGPDTLDKGMGGSEEAVVYLSRELAKLGWEVTVYNEREHYFLDKAGVDRDTNWIKVAYLPWQDFNPNDSFDVLVAHRNPSLFRMTQAKARLRVLDMHDIPAGHQEIKPEDLAYIDKVMFKSKFQRDWLEVPEGKAVIISNGIVESQYVRNEKPTIKRAARISQ